MTPGTPDEDVHALAASALFDEEWWGDQVGRGFGTRREAAEHYVVEHHRHPAATPHPLVSPAWFDPGGGAAQRGRNPVSAYLDTPRRHRRTTHPLLSMERLLEAAPAGRDHPAGPVDHWLRQARPETSVPVPRGAEPCTVGALVAAMRAATTRQPPETPPPPARGRVSLVLGEGSARRICLWLTGTAREHPDLDVEVVVAARLGPADQRLVLDVSAMVPGAVVVDVGSESLGRRLTAGLSAATGDTVVLVSVLPMPPFWAWLPQLVARVAHDGEPPVVAQPLLLTSQRYIASAGAALLDGRFGGGSLLQGAAVEEARGLGGHDLPGVERVAALRADVARDVGLRDTVPDPLLDLALRGRASRGLRSRCEPGARLVVAAGPSGEVSPQAAAAPPVTDGSAVWRSAGLRPRTDGDGRLVGLDAVRPTAIVEGVPALRWTIDTAVTDGPWGDQWGDWHFAQALATGLRAQGQHVSVDRRESRERPSRDLDDVVLVLRGRDRVGRPRGRCCVLWVISHPRSVDEDELGSFDLVVGAGARWCRSVSTRLARPVGYLPQATDPARFHPRRSGEGVEGAEVPEVLFVGNARGGVPRPVVAAALAAGLRPEVHGSGWDGLLPPALHRAPYVANEDLGRLYARAGIVLSDHWPDMARQGFVSNRVYDALACATPVVSDVVPDDEALAPAVRQWSSPADLAEAVRRRDELFPPLPRRLRIAQHVAQAHSFSRRARQLIELVLSRTQAGRG